MDELQFGILFELEMKWPMLYCRSNDRITFTTEKQKISCVEIESIFITFVDRHGEGKKVLQL